MAYDEALVQQVRELLAEEPHVEEKKMFGSIGFMVNGKLCLGVGEHKGFSMMVRVGVENYEEALSMNGAHPTIMRGRVMKGYVSLTRDALKTRKDVEYWAALGLQHNASLIAS
jgi:TfoX/Sxy family transcriptional regulator of competence genes